MKTDADISHLSNGINAICMHACVCLFYLINDNCAIPIPPEEKYSKTIIV